MAFQQGYSGDEATGPFLSKNALGGALIIPLITGSGRRASARGRWLWRFYAVSILVIGRGFLFAGSRGAFMAVVGGIAGSSPSSSPTGGEGRRCFGSLSLEERWAFW